MTQTLTWTYKAPQGLSASLIGCTSWSLSFWKHSTGSLLSLQCSVSSHPPQVICSYHIFFPTQKYTWQHEALVSSILTQQIFTNLHFYMHLGIYLGKSFLIFSQDCVSLHMSSHVILLLTFCGHLAFQLDFQHYHNHHHHQPLECKLQKTSNHIYSMYCICSQRNTKQVLVQAETYSQHPF